MEKYQSNNGSACGASTRHEQKTGIASPAIYRVTETNIDGCGGSATEFVRFDAALSPAEEAEFRDALLAVKTGPDDLDTGDIIEEALSRFGKHNGTFCMAPYEGSIEF